MNQLPLDVRLADEADFGSFVPGRNLQACDAVRRLAAGGAEEVVWLWGPRAVGKTHLLKAACRHARRRGAGAALLSPGAAATPALIDGWGTCSLVCVDDVDRLAGDAAWEGALFRLFNELREQGAAQLFAAAAPPRAVPFGLPDLASRLASGPVYRLIPLSDAERLAAMRVRAGARGLELPAETGEFLLRRYPRDMRSLYRVLDLLDAASLAAQQGRLTVPFVKRVLEDT